MHHHSYAAGFSASGHSSRFNGSPISQTNTRRQGIKKETSLSSPARNIAENLDSLLSDLQRTTEVLRRANKGKEWDQADQSSNVQHTINSSYQHSTAASKLHEDDSSYSSPSSLQQQQQSQQPQRAAKNLTDGSIGGEIDSMMSSLQTEMDRHGIHTIPKGDCASCGKSIVGQVVIALGKMWHPEHYVCCHCGEEIGHRNFFERGGKAYCENDYHELFSPRCAQCNGAIKNRCITALGRTFHPEHFVCEECGRPLAEEGFHERNGMALCKEDFYRIYAPKCQGCQQPITSRFITALQTHWHPECFVCQVCATPFNGASFYADDENGLPLCEQHFHEKRGSLCTHCRRPINGRCVSAMGGKFHPEHFFCAYCNRQLYKGIFKEHKGRPYCQKCFERCCS